MATDPDQRYTAALHELGLALQHLALVTLVETDPEGRTIPVVTGDRGAAELALAQAWHAYVAVCDGDREAAVRAPEPGAAART